MDNNQNITIDPFQAAFAEQDRLKAEQDAVKNSSGFEGFEEQKHLSLDSGKWIGFRILGYPIEFRQSNTDPQIVCQSKIVTDDKKGFSKINWPFVIKNGKYQRDSNWILSKLYDTVMKKDWVKYTESDIGKLEGIRKNSENKIVNAKGYDAYPVFKYKNTETYQLIEFNKKDIKDESKNKFNPSFRILMNVISRMDDWCAVNKHSMLLSTKVGTKEYTDDSGQSVIRYFPQTGISKEMYDEICVYIRNAFNHWKVDLAIKRYEDNQGKWKCIITDAKLKDRNDTSIKDLLTDNVLTKDELEYTLYDIDRITQTCSYQKLLKKHIGLFKLFDKEFHDNLTEELINLAKAEKDKYDADKEKNKIVKGNPDDSIPWEDKSKEENKKEERKERPERILTTPSIEDQIKSIYKFWDTLCADDRADIIKLCDKIENGEIIWKPNTNLIPCDVCKMNLPKVVVHCPKCDADFSS